MNQEIAESQILSQTDTEDLRTDVEADKTEIDIAWGLVSSFKIS